MGCISGFLSLRKSADFSRVYKRGRYAHASSFVLYFLKGDQNFFGVVASKKVGKAVQRNFAKRRLRALFTEYRHELPAGSYILVAKAGLHDTSYETMRNEFVSAIKKTTGIERK